MAAKRAFITGAGSGIGRATAFRMAIEGARVLCADAKGDGAHETAEQIGKAGGDAVSLLVDVTNEGSCGRMVETALGRFGPRRAAGFWPRSREAGAGLKTSYPTNRSGSNLLPRARACPNDRRARSCLSPS